ncbi:MAG TPA: DinB family protein [Thermoanaerobaculia bacterium]|nr:DinB family protein [Thermoanaerobaculia bacterium]
MERDPLLREHLRKLLDWEDAHAGFDRAIDGISPARRGEVPQGQAHSLWQLLEHLRRCQLDILEFCRNPDYEEPPMEEYWPPAAAPPGDDAWRGSVAAFRRDREELKKLAADASVDLFATIPHGSGQTCELILVADHNAYHVGQIVAARRALGDW